MSNLFLLVICSIIFFTRHCCHTQYVGELQDQIAKVQQEIEAKHQHLKASDHHQYLTKVTDETAKFIFKYLDHDHNELLDRTELINMGKLSISNDTATVETFADVTMQSDKNDDQMLSFDEFYQPSIEYGEQRDHPDDHTHQHRDGHGYHGDPKHNDKYHHTEL